MNNKDYDIQELATYSPDGENIFFSHLRDRFLRLARYKIRENNDAEEVVQEAMMAVIDQYRNPKFKGTFLNWAFTVLRNKIVDYQRKKIRTNAKELALDEDPPTFIANGCDPEASLAGVELRDKIKKAMYGLNHKEIALLESLISGDTRHGMAAKLKLSTNTLYVKVNRLRCKLQRLIFREGHSV